MKLSKARGEFTLLQIISLQKGAICFISGFQLVIPSWLFAVALMVSASRALVAVSGAGTQPGSERERESKSESSSATATATASDGTDGLLLAEATPEATVGAVVVLDPWISGYNCSTDGAAAAPTLALTTQSMMYPPNADAVGAVLGRVAAQGQTALFAELADSRHQEVCSQ